MIIPLVHNRPLLVHYIFAQYMDFPTIAYALQIMTITGCIFTGGKFLTHTVVHRAQMLRDQLLSSLHQGMGHVHIRLCLANTKFPTGVSSTLSLWIIPLSLHLPPHLAAAQFTRTITWGLQYLLPASRILAVLLCTTTILTSQLASPFEAQKWRIWALYMCSFATIAPYEIYLIFPINDRVAEIGRVLGKYEQDNEEVVEMHGKELHELLKKWQARNFGRVIMPVLVGVAGILSLTNR